ncbi:MAG: hypothetical protein O2958_04000 [Gemmatimonadetes bacterium]|nr:hypothetical protein [Gemmatimonadota bacterium]MDA1102467.1 hypothetical protein [Gemmatimonadota bacterium]
MTRDRTLVVPGTQATTLKDQDGRTVYNAVRIAIGLDRDDLGGRDLVEWQELLRLDHDPGSWAPARTSRIRGTTLAPGSVVATPYDRLPKPNVSFPYDWRLDCRYNALRLLERLRADRPARGRWNLVGHSQGGLLIVLASALARDSDEFASLVGRVVLVGCPLAGTQRASEAIMVGRGDFGDDPLSYEAARRMAQTWPALYQMLPAWDSVLDPSGRSVPSDQQLLRLGGYPEPWREGIREDLLVRARETHALMADPLSRLHGDIQVLVVQGEKQDTPTWITRVGETLVTSGAPVGDRPRPDFGMTKGDTLVPSDVTVRWCGDRFRSKALRLSGKVKGHAALCDGKFVAEKITRFLAALVVLFAGAVHGEISAQQYRVQAGGTGTFTDGHLLFGLEGTDDLGASDCEPGGVPCEVPEWTLVISAYGGLVTEEFPLTAFAQAGLERKVGEGLGLGLMGFALMKPRQWGLVGRLDGLDVGALKAGYSWGDEAGVVLAVEVAFAFLADLVR